MRLLISILLLCVLAHLSTQQSLNCYVPADIMFLIDGSDSIQDRDWNNMLLFVKNLIDQFDIAEDAIHVGMVVYSSGIGDHIALQPFKDKRLLGLFAQSLRQPKASTNTGKGIAYVRDQFKTYGRPGVPKIMIVITDGSSDKPRETADQANMAKGENIKILAVGIGGQQFREELRKIASNIRKVYTPSSFGFSQALVNEIRSMVCQVITTTPAIISTPPLPTLPPIDVPVDPNKICNVPGDIIFLLDGSNSISDADFVKLKSFISNMVDNFEISSDAIHIGMIVFSTVIGDTVGLTPKPKQLLKILASNLRQPKDGTNTALGIQRARTMFRTEGRDFAPKLLVVITDGKSTRPSSTIAEAQNAKNEKITIIAVGVGTAIFNQELNQIATSQRKVFEVSDFRSLELIINAMRDLICTAITTTPQFTTPMTPDPIFSTVPPPFGLICAVPADVGFILDGSNSIEDQDWTRVKNFVANLINNLEIGRDTIHAGLVVYSTTIGEVVNLAPYKDKWSLIQRTRQLVQPKDGTNTARGIKKMRELINAQGRPGAPKVMIIVTDGRSTIPRETIREAEYAKSDGFTIIAVGVGPQVFRQELSQIATNDAKLFEVSDFRELTRIIVAIRDRICQALETTPVPTLPTPPPSIDLPPYPGCEVPADIMILMHGSDDINEGNWLQNKRFVSNLIRNLYVGNQAHRIGFVVYNTNVGDVMGLKPFKAGHTLQTYTNSLVHPGAGANTAKGLAKLREIFRGQARPGAKHIGLVITDQTSTSPSLTAVEADLARKEGINLLSLGVGPRIGLNELKKISSNARQSFTTGGFNYLKNSLQPVRDMICEVAIGEVHKQYNYTELCAGCLFDRGTGFNPFPGDCSKYVKCWTDERNRVMGAVMDCPFGQFWDAQAITCRPSMNVWCPSDPCHRAPNGFTYGMPQHGCRSYWVCINQASVGSCCSPGTYYVEGMGCMRGMACNTPCPPDGGLIVSPFCNKEEHWDQRYYIEMIPERGKVVRPCAPGTRFSQNYCMCIVNNELIPIFPGDTCKAEAYYPFDYDLKDKSGNRVSTGNTNVQRSIFGTARFGGNSRLNLWRNFGIDWNDKILLRFKFKFDRWLNKYDYGGLMVDMGNGIHWIWDVDSGWTRNATVGGGWDLRRLLMLFQRLYSAQTEAELERIMIQIANSNDFRQLLYQIGFVPESSNAMQILRILISGEGALLVRQILQRLGTTPQYQDIRVLLQQLLAMHDMEKWVIDHGGHSNHTHITLANWRRFLASLNITGVHNLNPDGWMEFKIDGIDWGNDGRVIADLWRKFIIQTRPSGEEKRTIYTWTFGNSGTLTGNFDKNGLIAEMRRVLTNNQIRDLWLTFLRKNNIDASAFLKSGGWSADTNTGYEFLNIISNGSGSIGGTNIADLWRTFVHELQFIPGTDSTKFTWSLGGGTDINGARQEMTRVLTSPDTKSLWLYFLHRNNIDTSSLRGLGGWTGGVDLTYEWLNSLGGGTGTIGGKSIADLWRTFVTQLNLGPGDRDRYTWTFGGGSATDVNGLSNEMRIAMGNNQVKSLWLQYIQNNVDTSVLRGIGGWTIGTDLTFERLNMLGGGTGTIGGKSIVDLWRTFVTQLNLGPGDRDTYTWTFGGGNAADINGLSNEMRLAMGNNQVKSLWLLFLQNNVDTSVLRGSGRSGGTDLTFEWLNWLGGGTGTIGGKSIADLWRTFVMQLNLGPSDRNIYTWTFGGGSATDVNGLSMEMRRAMANNQVKSLWLLYLRRNNIDLSTLQGNEGWVNGYNLGYNWLDWIGGGTGTIGGYNIADLWRNFVLQLNVGAEDRQTIYTWTYGSGSAGGPLNVNELAAEMQRALQSSYVRAMWLYYLQMNNIDVSTLRVDGSSKNNLGFEYLYWLGGGTGMIGGRQISEIWRTFVQQLQISDSDKVNIFRWTFGSGGGTGNTNGLIMEMNVALNNIRISEQWRQFLIKNNINIQSNTNTGDWWYIIRLFTNNFSGTNLGYEWLNWISGGSGVLGGRSIAELWRTFVMQMNIVELDQRNIYKWTAGLGGGSTGAININGLAQEMRLSLLNRNVYNLWMNFLQSSNIDLSRLKGSAIWALAYNLGYQDLNQLGGGTGAVNGMSIADLWRHFVLQLDMDAEDKANIYTWTFGAQGSAADINGLVLEMRRALTNSFVKTMWMLYLQKNNIDISQLHVLAGSSGSSGGDASDIGWWSLLALAGALGDGEFSGVFRPPDLHNFGSLFGGGKVYIHGMVNRFGTSSGSSSGSAEVSGTGGITAELHSILNNLQGVSLHGGHGASSSSQASGGFGFGSGGLLFDEDLFGGFDLTRRKRDTNAVKERKKRQLDNRFTYQTLVSDCPEQGQRPSINIAANERSVKLNLMTAELELPVVPGWNEVTMVYDGRNMHGMVQNWRGKQHRNVPLNGKVSRSRGGLSIGGCPYTAGFKGEIDDMVIYKCVPEALKMTFGKK